MSYYQTLSVQETATQDEIKNAYRSLAKQYHPDRNPDISSKEKFQAVQEAYETLSDPSKRQQYDLSRQFSSANFNINDLFSQFGGNWSSEFDRHFNHEKSAPGKDVRLNATFNINDAYHGTSRVFDLGFDKVRVDFAPGLHTGMVLKVYGRGDYNRFNTTAPRGNLIININILPDDNLILQGHDIWMDSYVPFYDLILGTELTVETPFGKYKVNIPANTSSERILRIPNKGMPIYKTQDYGSLLIKVHAIFNCLDNEQLDLVNKIKELANGKS
jgi:DnaJ-class molecular chaperone